MAVITIYRTLADPPNWFKPWQRAESTPTQLSYVDGPRRVDFFGAGLTGGTVGPGVIHGFQVFDADLGGLLSSITGLDIGTTAFFRALLGGVGAASLLYEGYDIFYGTSGADTLDGYSGNDSLYAGDGDDVLVNAAYMGVDTLVGGAGNDRYLIGEHLLGTLGPRRVFEEPGQGWDIVEAGSDHHLSPNVEQLVLVGSGYRAEGNELDNLLVGTDSANWLDGDAGADTMRGALGNDRYVVDDPGDVLEDTAGVDVVASYVDGWVLGAGFDDLELHGFAANGTGNDLANRLLGTGAPNLLVGLGGDDLLDGGMGADTLLGGAGDDTYLIENEGDLVVELAQGGADTIETSVSLQMPDWVETARIVVHYSAQVVGNDLDNLITGGEYDDVLDGGAGRDTLVGGWGNDTYVVDDAGDLVLEVPGTSSLDSLILMGPFWSGVPAGIEHIVLGGEAAFDFAGAPGVLWLTGNAAANVLKGAPLLDGEGGADRLIGDHGYNQLRGGAGADTLLAGGDDDILIGDGGDDRLEGEGGRDQARYAGNRSGYTISRGWGEVTVSGAEGTDVLVGIARIVFADAEVVLDLHPVYGVIALQGLAMANRSLTAVDQLQDLDGRGPGPVAWQWFRGDIPVSGATAPVLPLGSADVGAAFRVRAVFIDAQGNTETSWSQPTAAVVPEDLTAPQLQIESTSGGPAAADVVYRLMFDEPVTGLAQDDFAVLHGSVTAVGQDPTDARSWWVNVTPTAGFSGELGVQLLASAVTDAAGNVNAAQSAAPQQIDLLGPVVVSVNLDWLLLGWDQPIEVEFNRPLESTTGNVLVQVAGDPAPPTLVTVSAADLVAGRLLVQLPVSLAPGDQYRVTLPAGSVQVQGGHSLAGESWRTVDIPPVHWGEDRSERLSGDTFAELMRAAGGDDSLFGGGGNDLLDGGDGWDRAAYSGARREYLVGQTQVGHVVRDLTPGRSGRDALSDIETLLFDDCTVDLTLPARAQQLPDAALKTLQELYVGFFNRIPEAQGLGYWIDALAAGMSLATIADQFHDAGLAFGVYPQGLGNVAFIRIVYANVLGRPQGSPTAPKDDEIAHWDAWLKVAGHSRGAMVLKMLDDVHTWFTGHAEFGFVARHLDRKAEMADWFAVEQGLSLLDAQASIAFGRELAALVTPEGIDAAVALVGLAPGVA